MKNSLLEGFHHIALIVKDMDAAQKFFTDLGVGPFMAPPVQAAREIYRGKEIPVNTFKRREVLGKMGNTMLQLCQPLDGDSPWKQFLNTHGEGVHHIGCMVDDIEKQETLLREKGFEVVMSTRFQGGCGSCYADMSRIGGIWVEFIQRPKNDDGKI
jgi:methylmalonyl-CoA/ethylmalonyl-CoA epimerase